jgi:hypothetical protein
MADVNVTFVHPVDGRGMAVTVDDTMTAAEAVGELLTTNFMAPHPSGYELSVGGNIIGGDQTLAERGINNGAKIQIIPTAEAGTLLRS